MCLWSLNISRKYCKKIVSDKKNGVLIVVLDNHDHHVFTEWLFQ